MMLVIFLALAGLLIAYGSSRRWMRHLAVSGAGGRLLSHPTHYGLCCGLLVASAILLAGILVLVSTSAVLHPLIVAFVVSLLLVGCLLLARHILKPQFPARLILETITSFALLLCTTVSVLTACAIILSMLIESIRFFSWVHPIDFLFGTTWSPQFSTTDDGVDSSDFGLVPLLWGTFYISLIAVLLSSSIGLMTAIYLNQYATKKTRNTVKPLLEILAGIPTVVYGFFALTFLGPLLQDVGASVGLHIETTSVLTAGIIMGVMLIPFISSLSEDVMNAIPHAMVESAYGLGATKSETIKHIIIPAAFPGLVGAFTLTFSRAVGETMIVVMAAGIAATLSLNLFEPMTTVTVKIVSQLTGDFEFDTPQTLVAFALGLTLFVITFTMNAGAFYVVERFRQRYH
ncbi:MAG: phosphate ABC transporter permease subunit PstC [Alphaproteobacteria bacterium GM202ARS2]|nr:phosphate ABC transporter permease subunit PstC [Alphaproteobacteria bacterium GM202ARS2]